MVGIYKITNTINGKVYIGQAEDIERRWSAHQKDVEQKDFCLYRAMRKYGIENFYFEVIEECSLEELSEKEVYYINLYNSYINAENSNGYNMTLGGEGSRGFKHSIESREKIKRAKANMSEETREKIRQALKGEKSAWYGRKHTEEEKQKISKANKGRALTEEHKQKIKESHADFTGSKHPRARKVVCEGRLYSCTKECGLYYGLTKGSNLSSYLMGSKPMPKKWQERGLRYATEEDIEKLEKD